MRRDGPDAFFAQQNADGSLIARKNHWLDTAPELCLAASEHTEKLVGEVWSLAKTWGQIPNGLSCSVENLGRNWEADFILLNAADFTVAGGCACFPSSWNLQESTGKTLAEVNGIVPDLTPQLGPKIERFLKRIPEGQAFLRENWGLTRTAHLNYHPALKRECLDESVSSSEVYLRIEHQSFVRLPSGVLLGVRIEPVALTELIEKFPETARRLRNQLATMPDAVAIYKSLDAAIPRIVELLADV